MNIKDISRYDTFDEGDQASHLMYSQHCSGLLPINQIKCNNINYRLLKIRKNHLLKNISHLSSQIP